MQVHMDDMEKLSNGLFEPSKQLQTFNYHNAQQNELKLGSQDRHNKYCQEWLDQFYADWQS
eukprot:3313135-Ditylum_brightwellii.AAC.1